MWVPARQLMQNYEESSPRVMVQPICETGPKEGLQRLIAETRDRKEMG